MGVKSAKAELPQMDEKQKPLWRHESRAFAQINCILLKANDGGWEDGEMTEWGRVPAAQA